MNTDLTGIEDKARRMRSAIESIPRKHLPVTMLRFPNGACGDAVLLLGTYFADCGIDGFEYIVGERGRGDRNMWTSHAWLARGSLIVDIAADQFRDAPGPVIVANPSRWHSRWHTEDQPRSSDFRNWHGQGINELHRLYARIRSDLFS